MPADIRELPVELRAQPIPPGTHALHLVERLKAQVWTLGSLRPSRRLTAHEAEVYELCGHASQEIERLYRVLREMEDAFYTEAPLTTAEMLEDIEAALLRGLRGRPVATVYREP